MKQFGILATLVILATIMVFSCKDDQNDKAFGQSRQHDKPEVVTTISTDFNSNAFSASGDEIALLKELKLCDQNAADDQDELHPSCSPKFFRFFRLNNKTPLKDGFILLVKAGVNGFPLRRVLIFQREEENLIKLNGFYGNLIEQRPSKSGYPDLMIRFTDNIDQSLAYYNCLFQWNGMQYEYKLCEAIQEGGQEAPHRIKQEYIDSMAPEIKKILVDHQMIF